MKLCEYSEQPGCGGLLIEIKCGRLNCVKMSRLVLRKQSCSGPQDQGDQSGDRDLIGKQPCTGPEDQDDHQSADSDVIGNCHGVTPASLMHVSNTETIALLGYTNAKFVYRKDYAASIDCNRASRAGFRCFSLGERKQ